jgi:hypothetical protein
VHFAFVVYGLAALESIGNPAFCHAANPPSSAPAFSIPFVFISTTARADVCSLGQEQ